MSTVNEIKPIESRWDVPLQDNSKKIAEVDLLSKKIDQLHQRMVNFQELASSVHKLDKKTLNQKQAIIDHLLSVNFLLKQKVQFLATKAHEGVDFEELETHIEKETKDQDTLMAKFEKEKSDLEDRINTLSQENQNLRSTAEKAQSVANFTTIAVMLVSAVMGALVVTVL